MYAMVSDRSELADGKTPRGFRLRHKTQSSGMVLVPIMSMPFPPPHDLCPTCRLAHPVKTIHLSLEMGTVIVSQGVLAQLRSAGALDELGDFTYDQVVVNPPPLRMTGRQSRAEIDQANRAIIVHGQLNNKGVAAHG